MKKLYKKFLSVTAFLLVFCVLLTGCVNSGGGTLPAFAPPPEVAIGEDGLAVWSEVPGALYYAYVIDGGEEEITGETSAQLADGQTIKVKAVSGREGFTDSDFSAPQTYHKGVVDPAHDHTDLNSDGLCDVCKESVVEELSFYAVNDLHGKFMDSDSQPGVDEFTTYLKDLYADETREEILLSSGDMWQGTVESSSNKGQLMTEWMNEAGFVSMTLGNHEFDWGEAKLSPNSELAEFPFLAINVTYNGAMPDYCKASAVVERGDVKVGIIGAIGDCLSSISGEFQTGLRFATGNALTSLVKSEAERLREDEDCDLIVYSIHDGGSDFSSSGVNEVTNSDMEYYDTALSDGYVDLVFEAHTHKSYILKDEYGVYHLQGGGENRGVSCAEVSFNTANGEFTVSPKILSQTTYANSKLEDDPIVEELYQKHFPDSDPYKDVLGYNRSSKNSETILSKIAELYYEKGIEQWGAEYSGKIVAAGGYLNARSPYRIDAGNVTYSQLFSVLPFDNHIVLGRFTGTNLKKFLNRQNNMSAQYTIYSTISSSAIQNNETYYVIVDTYTSYYRSNNITEEDRIEEDLYARDLLAAFISGGGWA